MGSFLQLVFPLPVKKEHQPEYKAVRKIFQSVDNGEEESCLQELLYAPFKLDNYAGNDVTIIQGVFFNWSHPKFFMYIIRCKLAQNFS